MKIRCKFQKIDHLKFIGHLDVMRTFQKILRRAGLDVQYSAGFSPHPKLTFATPLGLGAVSVGEYLDVELNACPAKEEFVRRINEVSVPELKVLDACLLPDDAKNAMSLIAAADYEVRFREGFLSDHPETDPEAFFEGLVRFYEAPEVLVTKATKKNRVEVDVKKQIRKLERKGDRLFLQVDTGSASNLKPELVIETYAGAAGMSLPPNACEVCRLELYGEEEGGLKTLLEYGNAAF